MATEETGASKRRQKGAADKAAPAESVHVPIEVEGEAAEADAGAEAAAEEAVTEAASAPLTEEAMVEAAIHAGEEAAEADFAAQAEAASAECAELARKLASAEEDVRAAQAAAAESQDKMLRLQAEWENFRRRTAAERLEERERATEKLVGNLLPVIDDIERAIEHAAGEASTPEQMGQFVDGVAAVRAKMLDVLAHEGVEPIQPAGEAFDPLAHQAVGRVEDASVYDETVAEVYQPGYRMGGKVIRPAMVTVAYGGERRPAPEDEAGEPADDEAEA